MKVSKQDFDSFAPLWHVTVKVEYLYQTKIKGFQVPDNMDMRKLGACHKGIVVKHPLNKVVEPEPFPAFKIGGEYEIEIGDTVFFGWNAIFMMDKLDSHEIMIIEETDEIYLLLDYRELILCEREGEKFGLNGYCGGYHPKKEKRPPSLIYIPSQDWEKEVFDAVNGKILEADTSEYDLEKLIVTHAPKSQPIYLTKERINATEVKVGDIICFPYGFCLTLANKETDNYELFAINNREVCAYADPKTIDL